jgi:hypothetical protein
MVSFYRNLRERKGKTTSRPQSVMMDRLQESVKALISQLEELGVAYSMPEQVSNDAGERTNSRREAG